MVTINVSGILIFTAKVLITLMVVGMAMAGAGELIYNISITGRWEDFGETLRDISVGVAIYSFLVMLFGVIAFLAIALLWVMWTQWA
jgi:hypothetical protein